MQYPVINYNGKEYQKECGYIFYIYFICILYVYKYIYI